MEDRSSGLEDKVDVIEKIRKKRMKYEQNMQELWTPLKDQICKSWV
jgi:hypothetical protein